MAAPSSWHAAYPVPKAVPGTISREHVLGMLKHSKNTGSKDYILVDLRRNDFESLHPTIPALYKLFKDAGLQQIIWYCCRGSRAAGWFADYISEQGDEQMQSLALAEGVKGWATAGDEYVQWMSEYDAAAWA